MPIVNIQVKPPKNLVETVSKEIARVKAVTKSKNLRKNEDKLKKIADDVCKKYKAWETQTRGMRNRLVVLNEMMEGVVKATNFPFDGASNITIGYMAGLARTFKATFNKTAFQDPDIFSATTKDEKELPHDEAVQIEESVNNSFHVDCNGLDTMKGGTVPCFRDGTMIITGRWERNIEMCNDGKTYKSANDFIDDYPTFEDAGLSEEEYNDVLDQFIAVPELEVVTSFQYEAITQDGPEWELIPLAQFIAFPVTAKAISKMELYGVVHYETEAELKAKSKHGEYFPDQVNKLLAAATDGEHTDGWSASRNFIEGLAPKSDAEFKKPYKIIDGVYKADLDGDDILEKYLVSFCPERKIVLSFQPYHLRNNIDMAVDFRFIDRDDRFYGVSLAADGQDKFELLDTLHRHRNNVRTLVTSPILLANRTLKEDIDTNRSESVIRPGVVFWVPDVNNSVKQLQLNNLDQPGNSQDEENLIVRYLELTIGPTQAMSGKETPNDPRAPMGKTITLLNQANMRIDDYLDTYRRSVPAVAKLQCALLAQFGPDMIKYSVEQDGEIKHKEAKKELYLSKYLNWRAKRRSVTISPEFAMQRLGGLMQVYKTLQPGLAAQDKISIEIWNRMVTASGEPNKEAIMINSKQNPAAASAGVQAELEARMKGGGGQQAAAAAGSSAPPGAQMM